MVAPVGVGVYVGHCLGELGCWSIGLDGRGEGSVSGKVFFFLVLRNVMRGSIYD